MSDSHSQLMQIAQDTIEAARNGRWNQVMELYDRRAVKVIHPLSPDMIAKLVKCDEWVIARVQDVQSAIQQNLLEIQNQRRKLTILKHHWVAGSTTQSRHLLSI